jgi:lipid-A-disaccharide synthase-like uncharacterized protein
MTPANRSAHHIQYVIVVAVTLVIKVRFVSNNPWVMTVPAPNWYMSILQLINLFSFVISTQHLLNVLISVANKKGIKKNYSIAA